jgi:hypothetical protein
MKNIGPIGHPQTNPVHLKAEAERRARIHRDDPPVDKCPECERNGKDVRVKEDFRVLVNGRGVYRCPECKTAWQDANEEPKSSDKDFVIRDQEA